MCAQSLGNGSPTALQEVYSVLIMYTLDKVLKSTSYTEDQNVPRAT